MTSTLPLRAAERTALSRPALGLAPAFNSRSDHRGAGVEARESERRDTALVGGVHLRAGANEQVGDGDVVAVRGPVERRRAVRLRAG